MTLAFDQRRRSRHFQHPPPSDSSGGLWISRLDYGSLSLRPVDLLALLSELTGSPQPTRTFTSGLPTDWSPAPPPDMTTVATGQVPLTGLSPARVPTSIAAAPLPSFSERDALFVRLFSGQWGEVFTYEVGSQTREFVVKFGRTMKRASRQKNALKKREVDMRSWKQ